MNEIELCMEVLIMNDIVLQNKELLKYIKSVFLLEKEKRTLMISIKKDDELLKRLGKSRKYKEPVKPVEKDVFENLMSSEKMRANVMLLIVYLLLGGVLKYIGFHFFSNVIFVIGIFTFACGIIGNRDEISISASSNKYELLNYQSEMEKYNLAVQEDKKRVENELAAIPTIREDRAMLAKRYECASEQLKKFYDLGVVHPQYRGLIPMGMFYQYLETGRCSQLEGHEGCYNLYEQERRMGLIITQLNEVIAKLGEISDSMYDLQVALQESNRQIHKLSGYVNKNNQLLDVIKNHTEVVEYQNRQIQAETEFASTYLIMCDLLHKN